MDGAKQVGVCSGIMKVGWFGRMRANDMVDGRLFSGIKKGGNQEV